ncbi:MAG: phage antirepressor KilAC domain-containing protein [Prevotella sp.]|nr:phage antirepressor KilAC domain-containing protein [Prevotella sp.]MBR3479251.1 phage antirepressor KilAC domain-containing protein [Prevotella sp.]
MSQGYRHSKPVEITRRDGRKEIKYNSEWTQKGRLFLYDELKKANIIPLIEQ